MSKSSAEILLDCAIESITGSPGGSTSKKFREARKLLELAIRQHGFSHTDLKDAHDAIVDYHATWLNSNAPIGGGWESWAMIAAQKSEGVFNRGHILRGLLQRGDDEESREQVTSRRKHTM